MQVRFAPSTKKMILQSLRGSKVHRVLEIKPGNSVAEYTALSNSTLQLVENGEVIAEKTFEFNCPRQIQLTDMPDADVEIKEVKVEVEEKVEVEVEVEIEEDPVEEEQDESAPEDDGDSESESSEESDQDLF